MWVIDIRHWLDEETQSVAAVPQLKRKVEKLGEIIIYATSAYIGISERKKPKCWRRPKRKPCKGVLDIRLDEIEGKIHWQCDSCGDEGVVSGWQGLLWDMTVKPKNYH
ncbi:MAG: hypothetical protein JW786_03020 [Desulfobacterales bacterium]|nr:hypothetical protein [Desulfobacterales bacterium]